MKNELIRLFERYWVNIMLGGFFFAVALAIGCAILFDVFGEHKDLLYLLFGFSLVGMVVGAIKGDQWASLICKRLVRQPSIQLEPDYRYLLGNENHNLLKVMLRITGHSRRNIYIPKVFVWVEYESKRNREIFPIVLNEPVNVEQIVCKDKELSIPVRLKPLDQYFHNDAIESYNAKKKLKLFFNIQYQAEVIIFWRLKVPMKYEVSIMHDGIPTSSKSDFRG
ncbi:MAG: hypothetical protein HYX79_02140 [Chloroflexi bacterium]|nr:hypothetical protein [Chloroflexota bacterium]